MLTLQYVPYEELTDLDSERKIQKLIRIVKQDKVVLMEGTLNSKEEARLIEETMEQIDKKFKGVEVSSLNPSIKAKSVMESIKNMLIGNRKGMTIIGPANIVKEIKRDPNRIHLFTSKRRR